MKRKSYNGGVSKRELGFLLIGLGIGLLFAAAAVAESVLCFHHMFIIGFSWRPGSIVLALPFVVIAVGIILLRRAPRRLRS
jgi:hypothetical protein